MLAMEYRSLGRTGAQVSALCLGCMNFGDDCNEADSVALMHRALGDGINFWDTADVYSRGVSETIVGKALVGRREKVYHENCARVNKTCSSFFKSGLVPPVKEVWS